MDWRTRFPVGLALLAALMLAGGVSAATSMRLASTQGKARMKLASGLDPSARKSAHRGKVKSSTQAEQQGPDHGSVPSGPRLTTKETGHTKDKAHHAKKDKHHTTKDKVHKNKSHKRDKHRGHRGHHGHASHQAHNR